MCSYKIQSKFNCPGSPFFTIAQGFTEEEFYEGTYKFIWDKSRGDGELD